ncbi:hypothetical protein PIB30_016101 [Stylosanthes scabra]|uniref:Replication factor A C-terminal domain-containing protein n=1 Tax=Stylosanthes scabra TaxID=79078 RepID=A0ABU6Q767_9FABA|nr:hypothetical protein [Stylosanthes scabra]
MRHVENCKKSLHQNDDNQYECKECHHIDDRAILRYKVQIIVHDSTGFITLLLWNTEAKRLCEKEAKDLKLEDAVGEEEYPPTLNNMLSGGCSLGLKLLGDNASTIVHIGQISSESSIRYDEIKRGKSTVKTIEEVAKSTEKCDV